MTTLKALVLSVCFNRFGRWGHQDQQRTTELKEVKLASMFIDMRRQEQIFTGISFIPFFP